MPLIANLVTNIKADATQFNQTIAAALRKASTFNSSLGRLFGAISVAGSLAYLDNINKKLDDIGHGAEKLGISVDAFQRLNYIAKYSDTSIDSVQIAMKSLNRSIYEAAAGNEKLIGTFKDLHLNLNQLKNQSPDKTYLQVVEAVGKVKNANDQNAISQDLFAKAGQEQLLIIRNNLKGLSEEYDRVGVKFSESQIRNASDLEESQKHLKDAFLGASGSILDNLSPALKLIIDDMTTLVNLANSYGMSLKNASSYLADTTSNSTLNWLRNDFSSMFDRFAVTGTWFKNASFSVMGGVDQFFSDSARAQRILAGVPVGPRQTNYGDGPGFSVSPDAIGTAEPGGFGPMSYTGDQLKGLINNGAVDAFTTSLGMMSKKVMETTDAVSTYGATTKKAKVDTDNMISSLIDSGTKSSTESELKRILGGNLADLGEAQLNARMKGVSGLGFDKEYFTGAFDTAIKSAYENLAKNPNADITTNLNRASTEAKGLGPAFSEIVNELKKYQQKLTGNDTPKVEVTVSASPDFIVKVAQAQVMSVAIQAAAGKLMSEEAARIGTR